MDLHNASCELRNPPPVRWRWISGETAFIAGISLVAWLLV